MVGGVSSLRKRRRCMRYEQSEERKFHGRQTSKKNHVSGKHLFDQIISLRPTKGRVELSTSGFYLHTRLGEVYRVGPEDRILQ